MKPSTDTPDSDLLRAYARQGDGDAFRMLADRYAGMVYGTALRRLAECRAQGRFPMLQEDGDWEPIDLPRWYQ